MILANKIKNYKIINKKSNIYKKKKNDLSISNDKI